MVRTLFVLAAIVVVVAGIRAAEAILVPFLLAVFIAVMFAPALFWPKEPRPACLAPERPASPGHHRCRHARQRWYGPGETTAQQVVELLGAAIHIGQGEVGRALVP